MVFYKAANNCGFLFFKGHVSSMKKLAMLTVKGAIGLVPKAVRNKLKTNHKLTEFYSRSLQRSGLFYGFPSKKKSAALYNTFLKYQEKKIENEGVSSSDIKNIRAIVIGEHRLSRTFESLISAGIDPSVIYVVSSKQTDDQITRFSNLQAALEKLKKVGPELGYTFFINSGDRLVPAALKLMLQRTKLKVTSDASLVYCDTDFINAKQQRVSPHFLPDWNPELQLSTAYVSTGVMVLNSLLHSIDVFASTVAGLVTEMWLKAPNSVIEHVPFTLVHRDSDKDGCCTELDDIRALLEKHTKSTIAYNEEQGINHVQWLCSAQPLVSLIIPTKNGKELVEACIESILEKTTYQNFEILLIDNGSDEPASLAYFEELNKHPKVRVLNYPGVFNYSAINNFGVQHVSESSEVVGLINNDIEVIRPDWLTSMVGHAQREDIGCVGAKLLYSDGRIQHAGVVLGYGAGAGHAHKYFPRYHPGYMKRLIATQNYSAVTAACLLVKKSLFEDVGGLNETELTVAFNDVDFCLRVKEKGVRNVYCAEAELYHHESVSRGLDHAPEKAARFNRELAYLKDKWSSYIEHDPAYSPNLTLRRENFSVKTKEEF